MMVEAKSSVPFSGRLMPKSPRRMLPPDVKKMFCSRDHVPLQLAHRVEGLGWQYMRFANVRSMEAAPGPSCMLKIRPLPLWTRKGITWVFRSRCKMFFWWTWYMASTCSKDRTTSGLVRGLEVG